jgi:hypothetical protein
LPRLEEEGVSLAGQIRGPRCLHAETLPNTSPLVDLGPGPTVLARALIPEPCFWSPDLPAIYDVTVNLLRGGDIVETQRREIGLRSLGVRSRSFALAGKRWILRGVQEQSTTASLPRAWHEANAAYICGRIEDEKLAEAAQWGALTVAEAQGAADLRRLALHPGVGIALVCGALPPDFKASLEAPNLLLAQPIDGPETPRFEPWARAVFVKADDAELVRRVAALTGLPIVAVRPLANPLPVNQARAACDVLQRDLAPLGQFAGYIV